MNTQTYEIFFNYEIEERIILSGLRIRKCEFTKGRILDINKKTDVKF
jgi:hypothetical protein